MSSKAKTKNRLRHGWSLRSRAFAVLAFLVVLRMAMMALPLLSGLVRRHRSSRRLRGTAMEGMPWRMHGFGPQHPAIHDNGSGGLSFMDQASTLDPSIAAIDVALADDDLADLSRDEHARHLATLQRLRKRGLIRPAPSASAPSGNAYAWADEAVVEDRYTVLINTFRGRDKHVAHLIDHYAACAKLDRVAVVWNDVGRPLPPVIVRALARNEGRAAVALHATSNLTNRFRQQPVVRTSLIFATDEDVRYDCALVDYAFMLARRRPHAIVGFAPRSLVAVGDAFRYFWLGSYATGRYDTVWVTKGGFARREVYEQYHASEIFAGVRAEADLRVTGEDILFAFSHAFHDPSAEVKAVLVPRGSFRTLSVETSLAARTSEHRTGVFAMIQRILDRDDSGRGDLALRMYVDEWCAPFRAFLCDVVGRPEHFWRNFPVAPWTEVPFSDSPYVQV